MSLDIGEVVRESGAAASTLRYYEEKGLIRSIGRNGLRRQFNADVLDKLALINIGKEAGFSLEELTDMFGDYKRPAIDRDKLLHKANDLERSIKRLSALRDGLRHAAKCPQKNHFDCATFQRLLKLASKRKKRSATR